MNDIQSCYNDYNAWLGVPEWRHGDLAYATNASGSQAYTNVVLSAEYTSAPITASSDRLEIKVNESGDVIVTVKGEDDCLVEGVTVGVKLTDSARKKVSVSPEEGTVTVTDANGDAKFTFTGIKKGEAKATFTVEGLEDKEKITVKVK